MSNYTKGPWHWDSDPVKGDPHNRVRYRVCALGKTVTQVYYSSYEGGLTNAEADARLIAAAPDMYEALYLCEASLTEMERDGRVWACDIKALHAARTALSRALGEKREKESAL